MGKSENYLFLAHLSQGAITISQCRTSVVCCVVRHQQYALNDIFSETPGSRALIL